MRTEDDLRVALSTRERLAPDPGPVLAGIPAAARNLRRRRVLTSSAATACAAGAVAAVVTVRPCSPPPSQSPLRRQCRPVTQPAAPATTDAHAADRPDFFFTIEPTTVAGYEIRPSGLSPAGQSALVARAAGGDGVGGVSLGRPRARSRSRAMSSSSISSS